MRMCKVYKPAVKSLQRRMMFNVDMHHYINNDHLFSPQRKMWEQVLLDTVEILSGVAIAIDGDLYV